LGIQAVKASAQWPYRPLSRAFVYGRDLMCQESGCLQLFVTVLGKNWFKMCDTDSIDYDAIKLKYCSVLK